MPRVPTAQEGRIKGARISAPRAQAAVSKESLGGGRAAKGFTQAEQIFAEEKGKADQVATMEAASKLADAETTLLSDPDTGALNQFGKNSFSLSESVPQAFDQQADEIEKNLSNSDQIAAFRKSRQLGRNNLNKKIQGHVSRERVKFDNQTTDAFVESQANLAAVNYNDPKRVKLSLAMQKAAVEDHGKRNGIPPEAVKLRQLEVASETHANVVTKMLGEGDYKTAEKYFAGNKKEFTAANMATIQKDIETAGIRGRSQESTDLIMDETTSLAEGLDKARAIENPDIRDQTVRRVKERFEDQTRATRQADEDNYKQVSEMAKGVKNVDEIPPNQFNKLSLADQNRLANHVRNLNKGLEPAKNSQTFYDKMTIASSNRDQFMKMNLLKDQDKIHPAEMSKLIGMQTSMRQGKGGGQELKGFETKNQVTEGLLAEMDVDTKSKNKSARDQTRKFRQALDERIETFQGENKRFPSNSEIRQLGQDLQVEVVTDRGFIFDTRKRVFELEPGEVAEITSEEVPAQERAKATAALKNRGIANPTEEQVIQLYSTKIKRTRTRAGQ